jgi:acetyl esterase/lipase
MSETAYRAFDIVYQTHGTRPLLARLYLPVQPPPFAGVVEVHGGGWTSNDRTSNKAIHHALASAGIAVMAIDFRMPPEDKYPASVADVNLAIRWLKLHGEAFGIDPKRVGALGTSSGAHQLLLAVMRPGDPRYAALDPVHYGSAQGATADAGVPYLVICWPVADPLARYRMVRKRNNQRLIDAHHAYWRDEAEMAEGNPQLALERGEEVRLPPALLLQGTNDDNVPFDSADRFAAAYGRRGGAIKVERFPGEPHTFISRDPNSAASRRALAMIVEFVRAQARA